MQKTAVKKNVFADKATFILRKMLSCPERKWVIRDFTGENGVSIGMAQGVLETMWKRGYIERVKRSPDSYALLTNRDRLISDWVAEYRFEFNKFDKIFLNVLEDISDYLSDLTLVGGWIPYIYSSQGCLLIEQENGPDEYIHDLRQDIYERFVVLREALHMILSSGDSI